MKEGAKENLELELSNKDVELIKNQPRILIEASYKLEKVQQKFIRAFLDSITPEDPDFKKYYMRIVDLAERIGFTSKNVYKELPRQTKKLMSNVIEFTGEKDKVQVQWLCWCHYIPGSGFLEVQFHPALKPLYIKLKEEYEKREMERVFKFRSTYSIKIYELLKINEDKPSFKIELSELRFICGLKDNEYPLYGSIKQKILEKAKEEMDGQEEIDIKFNYLPSKIGNKVVGIRFEILKPGKEGEINKTAEPVDDEKIKELQEIFKSNDKTNKVFPLKDISYLVSAHGYDKVKEFFEKAEEYKYDNPVRFFKAAIKNDWKPNERTEESKANSGQKDVNSDKKKNEIERMRGLQLGN